MTEKPTYEQLEDELRGMRAKAHLYELLCIQLREDRNWVVPYPLEPGEESEIRAHLDHASEGRIGTLQLADLFEPTVARLLDALQAPRTLVAIGFMSEYRCYLNLPRHEAIDRYMREHVVPGYPSGVWEPGYETRADVEKMTEEFAFTDQFMAYQVWPVTPPQDLPAGR